MVRRSDVNHGACGLFQILCYSLEATVHQRLQSVVHDQWADEVRNYDILCSLTVILPLVINRTVKILHLKLCMHDKGHFPTFSQWILASFTSIYNVLNFGKVT